MSFRRSDSSETIVRWAVRSLSASPSDCSVYDEVRDRGTSSRNAESPSVNRESPSVSACAAYKSCVVVSPDSSAPKRPAADDADAGGAYRSVSKASTGGLGGRAALIAASVAASGPASGAASDAASGAASAAASGAALGVA